jgi:hypothetical protein
MIDRVAADLGRRLVEVPVGFKWFVPGLLDGSGPFGGEESAGASFLRTTARCGRPTRTASCWPCSPPRSSPRTGRSARASTTALTAKHGEPAYARIDAPANREQKAKLGCAVTDDVKRGFPCGRADHGQADRGSRQRRGDRRPQGRHRVGVVRGPARVGTEDVYKIYAESFRARAPGAGAGRGQGGRDSASDTDNCAGMNTESGASASRRGFARGELCRTARKTSGFSRRAWPASARLSASWSLPATNPTNRSHRVDRLPGAPATS